MTTDNALDSVPVPEALLGALVDQMRGFRAIETPQVEAAFRTVQRHLFLPGVDLQTAYANQVVRIKSAADGTTLSSASHPCIVSMMLEQLDVQPGQRILEIGAGTGYNAALLQEIVGPTGQVTTVEIDPDITAGAWRSLATTGYDDIDVICGDGADGYPPNAPYDRIVVTAGAWDIPAAWWEQLAPGGILVVPLRMRGLTRSIAFTPRSGRMVSTSAKVCGFVDMQGAGAHDDRTVPVSDDVMLQIDSDTPVDALALGQALSHPRVEEWTGVSYGEDDPVEHLDLWLATRLDGFSRLRVQPHVRDRGLIAPAPRWGGAAFYDAGTFAFLTLRPVSSGSQELGIVAYGPDGEKLTSRIVQQLRIWDRERPSQPAIVAYPAGTVDDLISDGYRIDKQDIRLTVGW